MSLFWDKMYTLFGRGVKRIPHWWLQMRYTVDSRQLEPSLTRTRCLVEPKSISPGFPHTFTVILPSVSRTLDNSSLPLARSNFCYRSDPAFRSFLYNFTHDHSNHVISAWKVGKKPCIEVRNIEFIWNNRVYFLSFLFCHSSSNLVFILGYFVA